MSTDPLSGFVLGFKVDKNAIQILHTLDGKAGVKAMEFEICQENPYDANTEACFSANAKNFLFLQFAAPDMLFKNVADIVLRFAPGKMELAEAEMKKSLSNPDERRIYLHLLTRENV